jgi:hypothetical protein
VLRPYVSQFEGVNKATGEVASTQQEFAVTLCRGLHRALFDGLEACRIDTNGRPQVNGRAFERASRML